MWLICRIHLSTRGTKPFTAGFWAEQDVPDKDRGNWTHRTVPASAGVFILGTGLSFSLGTASQSGDGFVGSGWKAGTIVPTPGLKPANKCVGDVCAVK